MVYEQVVKRECKLSGRGSAKQTLTSLSLCLTSTGVNGSRWSSLLVKRLQGPGQLSLAELRLDIQGDDNDWDFYWASVTTVKQIFSLENTVRLEPHQVINHFPNHYELTRKVSSNTGT